MIDRESRNRLIAAIESYINEEITAFRFDEIIMDEIETEDPTVNEIINLLWYFYDDCHDHKVHLVKHDWDFYQRMILILKSDDALSVTKNKIWNIRQLIAAILLASFLCIAFKTGWGDHLFAVAIPFGIVSIWLSHCKKSSEDKSDPDDFRLFPFSSFSELLQFRRRVKQFRKPTLPKRFIAKFHNESKVSRILLIPQCNLIWLLFSPLVLLYQIFPDTVRKYEIKQI